MAEGSGDVERLRRIAYGREAGAADRAAAQAALQALEEGSRAPREPLAAESVSAAEAPASPEGGSGAAGDADDGEPVSVWGRRIRVGWLAPVVAGSLVVGALGALGALQATGRLTPEAQSDGPDTTSFSALPREGATQIPGDLGRADAWFEGSATASDVYPFAGLLESNGIDPYDVRFALAAGGGWNVWVGRSTDRKLCLLIADARDDTGAAGCVMRQAFAASGLQLGLGGRTAHWSGGEVSVTG